MILCDHIDSLRITKLFMQPLSGDSYRVFSNNQRESVGYFQVLASSSDLARDRDIAGEPASSFPVTDRGCTNVNGQPLELHNQDSTATSHSTTRRASLQLTMALPRSLPSLAASKTALARTTHASRSRFTAPSTTSACAAATTRAFSSSATRPASHEQHYDPPGGWLWGIPPGQKYENEGWEPIWYWGFFGSLGLAVVAYCYKPDTRYALVPLMR